MTVKADRIRFVFLGSAVALAACASNGQGWQGAANEKLYDFNLEAVRATAVLNNDDYYEYHRDGRIYVLADAADVQSLETTGEIPFRVTRIGGGPKGETLVFAIAKPESKKKDGFGAVEMYEGRRAGADRNFYAEINRDDTWYLFGDWASLDAFRKSGSTAGFKSASASQDGTAIFAAGDADALLARFTGLHRH